MRRLIGTWTPGELPRWVSLAVKLTLLILMATRGVDYLTGDGEYIAANLTEVERAAPLWLWGGVLVFFAFTGFVGMLIRQAKMIFAGHAAGWIIYWALAVGIFIDLLKEAEGVSNLELASIAILLITAISAGFLIHGGTISEHSFYVFLAIGIALAFGILTLGVDGIRSASGLLGVGMLHFWMAAGIAARERQHLIIREEEKQVPDAT